MAYQDHQIARILFEFGLVSLAVFVLAEYLKPGVISATIDLIWYAAIVVVAGLVALRHNVRR